MAYETEYVITLKNQTSSKTKTAVAGAETTKQTSKTETSQEAIKGVVVYGLTKKLANQAISFSISQVTVTQGTAEYQQKLQFAYGVAQTAFSITEQVAIGFVAGGAVGAAVGAVVGVASKGIDIAYNQMAINNKENLENITISQYNLRAGYNNSRSGTE